MKVLIVYYSMYGHIHKMAEAVAEGAREIDGTEVVLRRVPETLSEEVLGKMGAVEALSLCINSAKTGFYLRVLVEGLIQSGDHIEVDYVNVSAPTVEEVHNLYYLDKKNVNVLTKASRCNSLAAAWKDEFNNRIRKLSAKAVG